jgi:DNA mismatch repair protein MutS2
MIYPNNFEKKIGFDEIRELLKGYCLSNLGREMVDNITFSNDLTDITEKFEQIKEFKRIEESGENFPTDYFFDVRDSIKRIRLEGTHMEEEELFNLRRSLQSATDIITFLNKDNSQNGNNKNYKNNDATAPDDAEDARSYSYPALQRLTEGITSFPALTRRIDTVIDKFGHIKDNASMTLANIRNELSKTEGSISRTLYTILRTAQNEGLVDKDASPTLRDGRLVIPVAPALKRKIHGIVHDESATGKTVFIEPTEVVEANNKVRELEAEEKREVIRILTIVTDEIRPHVNELLGIYSMMAKIDLVRAKAQIGNRMKATEPDTVGNPVIDWIGAIHPILQMSLEKQNKKVVPLDIMLTEEKRILIISGPNAGGKSVCLKTVGLLQYMLQCGLDIPLNEHSKAGIFDNIMIDIGDEQSIENDLSTYSSHLMNMKNMMKQADGKTLLLIDEFGTGTEPLIGGAIAEAVLKQFCAKQAYGVITTHYQNLKRFADSHEGVANGAMLYDRNEMQALFQLSIGQPGSSFAIEIARKTGIPESVINDASEMVGDDYIQSDKYLQDIVRDKRYWERKRQNIHQKEKDLEDIISKYEKDAKEIEMNRKDILRRAKEEADELLRQSNAKIEATIKEIRESQAEKEETKKIRQELTSFRDEVKGINDSDTDDKIARKIEQIQQRRERHKQRMEQKQKESEEAKMKNDVAGRPAESIKINVGDTVRIKGQSATGTVERLEGKMAVVIFGDMKTKLKAERLEHAEKVEVEKPLTYQSIGRETRETIDEKKLNFKQDLDVRGMRGDEAVNAVMHFIDDAILVGMSTVRILHGKGNGILRELIRQFLGATPGVADYRDEHVQFGGSGITVVTLG